MRRASISLPVPLSPVISTVVSSRATFWTRLTTARIAALVPMTNSSSWASHLRGERFHAVAEVLPLAGVADERPERVVVELLGDVVVRAQLHRLDGRLDVGDGRDYDDLDLVALLPDVPQHLEPADARQPHVEQHEIDTVLAQA